jgi:hypothetical protein
MSTTHSNSDDNKSKANKIKDTDKGEHANKETAFVGLEINVKPFRKWFKEHYERQNKKVGIINAHYITASVDQILMFSFLHSLSDSFKKSKSGMYDVTIDAMKNHIYLTSYLNSTFHLCVDKYDENLDYQKQVPIERKALDQYITKYVFNDNFRMNINKDSMNFLCYLVVQSNVMLANTALIMSEYAHKSRVNSNAIIAAIKIHFSGKLLEDIMKKVDSVDTLLKNKEKQNSEKGDRDDEQIESVSKSSKNKSLDDDEKDVSEDEEVSEDEKEVSEDEKEVSEDEESESEDEDDKLPLKKGGKKPIEKVAKLVKPVVAKPKNHKK